jgi:oxygen-independent coproporphyrinogen III oxidase
MIPTSDLLKKYNVPGPRYTSYPTVPYWDTNPTIEEWIESISYALNEGVRSGIGAALYIHIPFCQSLCTYCGCNTRISRNPTTADHYVGVLHKEWDIYLEKLGKSHGNSFFMPITEIHVGGGTPTFLSAEEMDRLLSGILSRVKVLDHSEFSVEADPRTTTPEHLSVLARLGFTRLSLGIQDFDPKVQDIVHRVQNEEQVRAVTEKARELGFESVNYDLIYGLPLQTQKSVADTIDAVRRLKPDRIAFYAYAHVPWIKPGQRRFTEDDLPSGDEKRALYELGRKMLESVGYREIGMDHFALETDSLWKAAREGTLHRNFMGYISRQVSPLIGLGVSSIGDSWSVFSQNEKLLETYQAKVEKGELPLHRGHVLNDEDKVIRRHVLNVMTRFSTSWDKSELYIPFLDSVPERLSELAHDELVELGPKSCSVTEKGKAFLRNICMAFDARLVKNAPATQIFSKTI